MQYCSVFGDVDMFAGEHRSASSEDTLLISQRD
jgi:hypothetical protein